MKPHTREALQRLLGRPLPDDLAPTPIHAPQVEGERARGSLSLAPRTLRDLQEDAPWALAEGEALARAGLELRQSHAPEFQGWFALYSRDAQPLRVDGAAHQVPDPEDRAAVFVGLREDEPALLRTARGDEVALYLDASGRAHALLCASDPARLWVDLGPWMAEATDAWLIEQVQTRAHSGDPWEVLVAVGMALRLHLETRQRKKERVALALAGHTSTREAWAQDWAISLSDLTHDALKQRAIVETDELLADLARFQDDLLDDGDAPQADEPDAAEQGGDDPWQARLEQWGSLARRRDALHSALRVLDLGRGALWSPPHLSALDRLGALLAEVLWDVAQPPDPWRERAESNGCADWWGLP